MNHRINLVFEEFSLQSFAIKQIIRTCIKETLKAEKVTAKCEINVLVTNDAGIQTVNRESRNIDRPTDVLSFPMFQLEAGNPPEDWSENVRFSPDGVVSMAFTAMNVPFLIAGAHSDSVTMPFAGITTTYSFMTLPGWDGCVLSAERIFFPVSSYSSDV